MLKLEPCAPLSRGGGFEGGASFLLVLQATAVGVDTHLGTVRLSCLGWQSPATCCCRTLGMWLVCHKRFRIYALDLKTEYGKENKTPC